MYSEPKATWANLTALSEQEIRKLILEEDTFLKRPVVIDGKTIFVGNDKKTVEALKKHLG